MQREKLQQQVLKAMNFRYLIAVSILAVFIAGTFFIHLNIHRGMEDDFHTINISGRQRMLSQRLALLSSRKETNEILDTVIQFKEGHERLLKTRFVTREFPKILEMYEGPDGISTLSAQLLGQILKVPASLRNNEEIFRISQSVLKKYDQTTWLIQEASEAEYRNQLLYGVIILIFSFIVLIVEIFGIFIPMINRVGVTFQQLNQIEDESNKNSRLLILGEIAASIGHEIKNPLNIIVLAAESLRSRDSNRNIQKMVNLILKSCEQITKIVNSLSVQSRETSHDPMITVSLQSIIDDSLDLFSFKFRKHNIAIKKNLRYLDGISCRPGAISQVLTNLLSNATDSIVEHQNNSLNEIIIETELSPDSKFVYLRVIDSGPGVPPGLEEKIFESFYTTKPQGVGTGIGLAVSRRILEEHNGKLFLNTDISRSCFEIVLPVESASNT